MHEVDVVLDTGFNSALTLPPALIAALSLPFDSQSRVVLADGNTVASDGYAGVVLWDGAGRQVLVEAADGDALIRALLMDGYELRVEGDADGRGGDAPTAAVIRRKSLI